MSAWKFTSGAGTLPPHVNKNVSTSYQYSTPSSTSLDEDSNEVSGNITTSEYEQDDANPRPKSIKLWDDHDINSEECLGPSMVSEPNAPKEVEGDKRQDEKPTGTQGNCRKVLLWKDLKKNPYMDIIFQAICSGFFILAITESLFIENNNYHHVIKKLANDAFC